MTVGPTVFPGDLIAGKYRVERLIGEGAMGHVFAALHLQLGEKVALKFLRSDLAQDADLVGRFDQEARAAAKLKGENVCRVIDVGHLQSGAAFIVMEYLQGQDLERILASRGTLPIADAVEYTIQACAGLAEAHARGIVHRDIKPENLFLVEHDGWRVIKILDFGISKGALKGLTIGESGFNTSKAMGSPCYMPPEQLRSTRDVDCRADVWSLGAVLFELLTGHTPFDGHVPLSELICSVLEQPPRRLSAGRLDAPSGLEEVVSRCLEKDRERRYQSAAELAVALLPFAPRRARVVAERAVNLARAAGLAAATLQLPPSIFPSGSPVQAVQAGGLQAGSAPSLQTLGRLVASPVSVPLVPDSKDSLVSGMSAARSLGGRRSGVTRMVAVAASALAIVGGLAIALAVAKLAARSTGAPAAAVHPISLPAASVAALATIPTPPEASPAPVEQSAAKPPPLHLASTPTGAAVTEAGRPICAATPCDVVFEDGDIYADHPLRFSKAGFAPQSRVAHAGDTLLAVSLARSLPAQVAPPAPRPATPGVPQGFKDIPY